MITPLFKYQRQGIQWMLQRESGGAAKADSLFWRRFSLLDGSVLYSNEFSGELSRQISDKEEGSVAGGILADEMGLGKTLMMLGLVSLNRPTPDHKAV